jgi:hypothetical protein
MMDDNRTGASIPHPSPDAGGAVAASALAPSAVSFARQAGDAPPIGAGGDGSAGAFSGAPSSGGRGGGSGRSSAAALIDAADTPSARAANTKQRALGIEGAVIGTPG